MARSFDVFLSHTNRDRPAVRKIAEALADAGLNVWFKEQNMRIGAALQPALKDAINNSKSALIIVGESGIGSWQEYEISEALRYAFEERRLTFPVFLPGAEMSSLPVSLKLFVGVRIKSWSDEDFQDALNEIIWAITGKLKAPPRPAPIPKVFLCHAKEDDSKVRNLYFRLRDYDIDPWYDKEKLLVGDRWEQEIINAIESTDFFAICLSQKSIKKTGFIQREIKLAVREYQQRPQQSAFLLPVRLEPCKVPSIKLDEVTTLSDFQWIDLFEEEEDSLRRFAEGVRRQFARLHQDST